MWKIVSANLLVVFLASAAFGQSAIPQNTWSNPLLPTDPVVPQIDLAVASESDSQSKSPTATLTGQPATPPGGTGQNNGTNPALPVTTFIVNNEFIRLRGGDSINTVYSRFKFPWFGGKGGVTLEIPYVYYDLSGSAPNLPHIGGLGDIAINTSYNFWTSEDKHWTVVGLFNTFLPTADNLLLARPLPEASLTALNLGTGKYVLAGGAAVVYAFAPNFIIAPTYLFEGSAWGNEDRPDIRRGKFRLFMMYAWQSGVYVLPEFQALTNYRNGATDFYLAPELGYSFKGTTLSVKPGFGIDAKRGEREWGLSLAAKINF
jgi:hypothetical protein